METAVLKEFGLTKNEIDIFLTIVKKGSLSATAIAKETGLNRPYIYYALERLLEKGYLSEIRVKGKKQFQHISFDQVAALEEQKLELLKKLLDDLKKIQPESDEEISVEVLKGKFVVKNIFRKILVEIKPQEELLSLGLDEEKMEEVEPLYLKKILNYFKQKKITERSIIRRGGKKLSYAKTTRYRILKPNLLGNTVKIIYQDIVIELLHGVPLYAIITKNKEVADTARKQFEFFWKHARD